MVKSVGRCRSKKHPYTWVETWGGYCSVCNERSSKMEISDFKKAKQELEDNIMRLLADFENNTGTSITGVMVRMVEVGDASDPDRKAISEVVVGVRL